jgi:hypothetical protein
VGAFVPRARERTRSFTATMGEPLDTLTLRQKQFVVEQLAAFGSPSEVAKGLLEQFGVTVASHVVAAYDPTRRAGQRCPALWKQRFLDAREAMIHGTPSALASRSVRLQQREKMFRRAIEQEDFLLANRILDSIAREVGDDTSGLERRTEITDEQRARTLAVFVEKWRWKAQALRPSTPEEAAAWDRDPVAQFMAMLGPAPKKPRRRGAQPVKPPQQ